MGFQRPANLLGFSPREAQAEARVEAEIMAGLLPSRFERNLRAGELGRARVTLEELRQVFTRAAET